MHRIRYHCSLRRMTNLSNHNNNSHIMLISFFAYYLLSCTTDPPLFLRVSFYIPRLLPPLFARFARVPWYTRTKGTEALNLGTVAQGDCNLRFKFPMVGTHETLFSCHLTRSMPLLLFQLLLVRRVNIINTCPLQATREFSVQFFRSHGNSKLCRVGPRVNS